ncbi:MAG TPA: hypothetical protein VF318_09170 [Dehalococcoidales bacterium]
MKKTFIALLLVFCVSFPLYDAQSTITDIEGFLPTPHDGYTHFLFPTRPFERGASNQSRQTCYGSEADVFAIR